MLPFMRWIHFLGATLLASMVGSMAAPGSATRAGLILESEAVRPGETFLAAVELAMNPGWHTYWRNGGDSGAPTRIDWTLPGGWTAGDIRWPVPERYDQAGIVTYVYHGAVLLLVPITVAADAAPGPAVLRASVHWLECEKLCVPGSGKVEARVQVGAESRPSPDAGRIRGAATRIPTAVPAGTASAAWDGPAQGKERPLLIRWSKDGGGGTPDFFPYGGKGFEVSTGTDILPGDGTAVMLRKKVTRIDGSWPESVAGLLVLKDAGQKVLQAAEAVLPIADTAGGASAGPGAVVPATPDLEGSPGGAPGPIAAGTPFSLGRALFFAFVGGLILNIMPCVLPVIALKILGFVRQSGSRPAEVRKLGLIYGLGVWFSFLVLAGVVIAVKQAVGVASWGMQFGNPLFLVGMTTLVLLVALSLFGVFEINLAGRAMDTAGDLAGKEGPAGAFFNGMLAVALATPCTAPFLAPALGFAFAPSASAGTLVLVFSAVAAGLAAPYVILSWQPAWLKFLPKPGAWMVRFKVAMGFPMLATAVWLYTLAAGRFGRSGALWLGLFLVGMAVAAWVWGEFVQRGRRRQGLATAVALGIAVLAYVFALERRLQWRSPRVSEASERATSPATADGIPWRTWSRDAVREARASGRPVFVDFTADWCVTCQANETWAIDVPPVRAKLKEIEAVPLKGDYTDVPPAITEELQRFNRAGVPLVLVYPRDAAQDPIVLPELLTSRIVLDALERAAL